MATLDVRAGRSCAAVPDIRAEGLPEVLIAVRRLRSAHGSGRRARCVCAARRALPPIRSSPPFRPWWRWPPNFTTGWANPSKPVNPWVSNHSTGLHYGLGGLVHYYRISLCFRSFVPVTFGPGTKSGFCPGSKRAGGTGAFCPGWSHQPGQKASPRDSSKGSYSLLSHMYYLGELASRPCARQ